MRRLPRIDALAAGMEQLAADLRAGEVVIVHRADLAAGLPSGLRVAPPAATSAGPIRTPR